MGHVKIIPGQLTGGIYTSRKGLVNQIVLGDDHGADQKKHDGGGLDRRIEM